MAAGGVSSVVVLLLRGSQPSSFLHQFQRLPSYEMLIIAGPRLALLPPGIRSTPASTNRICDVLHETVQRRTI